MSLIITGFRPFCDNKVNPSEVIVRLLNHVKIKKKYIVDVSIRAVDICLFDYIKNNLEEDDIIIHLGLDSSSNNIKIEEGAINYMDFSCKDNDGVLIRDKVIDNSLERKEYIKTDLKLDKIKEYGILSRSGGSFISNYIYFCSLNWLSEKALYIHLPPFNVVSEREQLKRISEILDVL